MFKKTMTFEDFDGNEVTQTFYFNYFKAEIAELLEFGEIRKFASGQTKLPLEQQLELLSTPTEKSGLSEQENTQQAYDIFKDLLLNAYGEKDGGSSFKKDRQLRSYWEGHVAFDDLIFEMLEDTTLMNDFIMQCLPPKIIEQLKAQADVEIPPVLVPMGDDAPVAPKKPVEYTAADISEMGDEDFRRLDPQKLSQDAMVAAFRRKLS